MACRAGHCHRQLLLLRRRQRLLCIVFSSPFFLFCECVQLISTDDGVLRRNSCIQQRAVYAETPYDWEQTPSACSSLALHAILTDRMKLAKDAHFATKLQRVARVIRKCQTQKVPTRKYALWNTTFLSYQWRSVKCEVKKVPHSHKHVLLHWEDRHVKMQQVQLNLFLLSAEMPNAVNACTVHRSLPLAIQMWI